MGKPASRAEKTMERDALKRLLRDVRDRKVGVPEAVERLRHGPVQEIGFAALDLHRALRRGFPEVVYGAGKTIEQIATITERLHVAGQTVLVTRVGPEVHEALLPRFPRIRYYPQARALVLHVRSPRKGRPGVVVMSAGTSDIPVAEEAAVTAEVMGNAVRRVYDVGVAGLHRLMSHRETLLSARVIVVVAGMEGALPSVVGGLVECPVIGVPTSTGYGAGAGGHAALLAMLNSCASGVAVVNIDNGFGAGYLAALINRERSRTATNK
jgi:pyridinium-3,5-biscarboxylic acid mononucleotide synthase